MLLSQQLSPTPLPDTRLMEMHYGDWEGRRWTDIGRAQLDAWVDDLEHHAVPNGESLGDVHRRGVAFMEELQTKTHRSAFVVTHGGVVRCLVAHIIGLELVHTPRLQVDCTSVTHIRLDERSRHLQGMNL